MIEMFAVNLKSVVREFVFFLSSQSQRKIKSYAEKLKIKQQQK